MFISLNEEEKQLLKKESKTYTPLKVSTEYNTPKERFIVERYNQGIPLKDISKEANVSIGLIYTVLNSYKVSKRNNKSQVEKRIEHILNDPVKIKNIITDYQFMNLQDIYKKYDIHKNGLYYLLDLYHVDRKTNDKDKVLEEDIVVE